MKTPVTRRNFLVGVGGLCGGVALASHLGQSLRADETHPVRLAACRDVILPPVGQKDCWSALRAIGAEGVEVRVADDLTLPGLFDPSVKHTLATPAGIERLAADAKAAGQQITAFLMGNRFPDRPDFEIERCIEVASAAHALGVPAIRIDVTPGKMARAPFLNLAMEALKKVVAGTEGTSVAFGIENHGTATNDPAVLNTLFDGVGSKRLGLTLDTANFYWFGHPLAKVYELYETFAPRVVHTHCKNICYPAAEREKQRPMGWKYAEYASPIDKGDIDFARVVAILHKAGYHNDLCVEDEFLGKLSPTDATQRLAGQIQLLKRVRAEVSA
jgi:sugar phosphate isomerase/epimerase